jgi:transcriptional regulator with XRE-family HTH domain
MHAFLECGIDATVTSGDMHDFGKRVKAARERRGISQSELARRISVDPSTISKLESGMIFATGHAYAISQALGCSIRYLAGETDEFGMDESDAPSLALQLFADRLNLARRQRGFLKSANLARRAGLSATRVKLLETAQAEPTVEELIGLREALGMTLDYLVAGVGHVEVEEEEPVAGSRRVHEPSTSARKSGGNPLRTKTIQEEESR